MFPLSHKGRGDLRADFLTSMQDSDSPLPLWEREADTCNDFWSGAGEGFSAVNMNALGIISPAVRRRTRPGPSAGRWVSRPEARC
jgi:hypothetical protein